MTDIHEQLKNLSPEKRELFELMLKEKGVDVIGSKIVPHDRKTNKFPLSFGQQRMWFLDQLEPGTPLYNNPAAVMLKGDLKISVLENALNEIVHRHEVLRTTFTTEDDQPIQVINEEMPIKLEQMDMRNLAESARERKAMGIAMEEAQTPFNLATGPLFRVTLLQIADQEFLMILVMHHIVSDGWSLSIFIQEVAILYKVLVAGHESPLPDLAIQYADFAHWQRQWMQSKVLEDQLSYWKEQLKTAPPVLNLPLDRPRPVYQTTNGTTHFFEFPDHFRQAIDTMTKQEDVTLFMIFLAAFNAFLYRYTSQDDICIGTPIAGRNRRETESLIGFFVNTLVMRTDLSGNPTVRELLTRVKEVALGAYGHQDIPFETLVEKLQPERDMSISPFFQVMFVHLDTTAQSIELPDITIEPRQIDNGTAKFDLTLVIEDNGEKLSGQVVYNTDLFESATIARMIEHFTNLVEGIMANPEQSISEIPMLSDSEIHQVLVDWNESTPYYPIINNKFVHQMFEEQVEKTPDAIAVILENVHLTYRELNQRANQLAHYLRTRGVGPEVLVGVCMDQSLEIIVALIGILKAGGAFLLLDPEYPEERLSYMVEDSRISLLLTRESSADILPEKETPVVFMDSDWEKIAKQRPDNPENISSAESLAYVIYTSGSTGKPKGVLISNGAISNHCINMQKHYELNNEDRVLQIASLSFDAAFEQILPTLMTGARVVLRGAEVWNTSEFYKKMLEFDLTIMNLPTAYWHQLSKEWANLDDSIINGRLKHVIIGGDLIKTETVRLWQKASVNTLHLLNAYGPTEATITSTMFEIPAQLEDNAGITMPIGYPLPHRTVYILDQYGNPVPIGISGELHIGGPCIARGYLNRPDLTADRFIPDPFSQQKGARLYKTGDMVRYLPGGIIDFLGRVDHQVKIRGFRIDTGEIEAVLSQHPVVQDIVVVPDKQSTGDERLLAYLVVDAGGEHTPLINSELRSYLKEKLPDYMIPSAIVTLDELPRTPIGKVDRKRLPKPDQLRPDMETEFVAPRTPTEEKLVEIVKQILKVDKVGVYDNFFELGGHSMLATQVVSRIRNIFGVEISLRSLFENPTINGIANAIAEAQVHLQDEEELESMLTELEGLSDEEAQTLFNDVEEEQKQFHTEQDQNSGNCNQSHVAPRNDLEKYLVDVWKEILSVDKVSVYDHFFEIGGDSDKASKVLKRLEVDFNETAPPGAIYQAPSLVNFAMSMLEYYQESIEEKLGKISNYPEEYYKKIKVRNDIERIDLNKVQQCRNLVKPLAARLNQHDESRTKNRKTIFVLSPPRSGSTLLRVMLAGNKNLFSPPELDLLSFNTLQERQLFFESSGLSLWLEALIRVLMEIKKCNAKQAQKILDDLLNNNLSIKEFYRVLQDWIGNRMLVDKTPSYFLDKKILQRAENDFDEPFYVHLIRHPYAMIYSFVEARLDQHFFKYKHHFSRRELAELIWIISHQNILEFSNEIPETRKFRLKFENLVVEPHLELERVCNFLKIDFQEQMMEPYQGNKMTDGIKPDSQMVGDFKFYLRKRIDPNVTDRWKKFHKQDFLSEISKDLAAKFGYET